MFPPLTACFIFSSVDSLKETIAPSQLECELKDCYLSLFCEKNSHAVILLLTCKTYASEVDRIFEICVGL